MRCLGWGGAAGVEGGGVGVVRVFVLDGGMESVEDGDTVLVARGQ